MARARGCESDSKSRISSQAIMSQTFPAAVAPEGRSLGLQVAAAKGVL